MHSLARTSTNPFPILKVDAAHADRWGLPALLFDVPEPPETLYLQGSETAFEHLKRLPHQGLAVVGTRKPQPRSANLVRKSIHSLEKTPLVIVSGFARGIDSVAHSAAIEAGLPTLAVLGCGHSIPYPHQNRELREKILAADGVIASEFAPDTQPRPHFFLLRNRLIAHWTQATWVAEAAHQSGALNTASWAIQAHKTVLATPCYPDDLHFQGNQRLIDRDLALPYWGPHSLGSVWLELASLSFREPPQIQLSKNALELFKFVQLKTLEDGGISLFDLQTWALSQGIGTQALQESLAEAVQKGHISQHLGTVYAKLG